jgi:hypothetical protein
MLFEFLEFSHIFPVMLWHIATAAFKVSPVFYLNGIVKHAP